VGEIETTSRLIGSLSEVYFKEYCNQRDWAYISLEQIHENGIKDNVLKFRHGYNRILIRLPETIIKEVEQISKPLYSSILKPSFVYDFLTCKVGSTYKDEEIIKVKNKKHFSWVEVKTGSRELSKRQIRTLEKITIPLYRFRVPNPLLGDKVDIFYDLVDEIYLFEHDLDSKTNKIFIAQNSLKKNKPSFKKVTPEKFSKIKKGLKKLFQVTPCQSNDPHISERFEIVKSGAKFPVSYYKKGTLLIQGDESLDDFQRVIKFIEFSLKNDAFSHYDVG